MKKQLIYEDIIIVSENLWIIIKACLLHKLFIKSSKIRQFFVITLI